MSNLHLINNGSRKNNSRGFYIALGVCLIAIGVAAWTTYDSVMNYSAPDGGTTSSTVTKQANETVSGIKVFASEPESTSEESSAVTSSEESTAEAVTHTVSSAVPQKPASTVPAKQATAQALTFSYPVSNTITQKYSGENPIFSQTMRDWRVHTGVDLGAKQGDAVKAVADGTVKNAYVDDLYGNTIVITHGDVEAYYSGLNQMSVKKGDKVKKGAQIGTVGTVPSESADVSHLHLAMKKGGKFIDPLSILK
jgi:murein DD-endopeptidase MepM/ murein hydrolase activator NlpD